MNGRKSGLSSLSIFPTSLITVSIAWLVFFSPHSPPPCAITQRWAFQRLPSTGVLVRHLTHFEFRVLRFCN